MKNVRNKIGKEDRKMQIENVAVIGMGALGMLFGTHIMDRQGA